MSGATFLQERWGQSMLLRQIHPVTLTVENSFSSTCEPDRGECNDNEKLTREEVVM